MSSNVVVHAEGLAKRYRLGRRERYRTLRDAISDFVARRTPPVRDEWVDALRGVSFDVRAGEVVGIIGRNGAGKSTLLKVLARITEPTAGRAEIRGRMSSLLEVGTGFHPELTGRENIFLNAAILGMRRTEIVRRFDEIVAFAEVERFIDTPVKHYSSGMYLRLAFAVAAHMEPEILVVDEVLAVGDAGFQKKCLNKMQDVGRQGRTVLFVSHNMSAVENLCSRGILLSDGAIVADGPVEEVIGRYASSMDSELRLSLADRIDRKGDGSLRFESIALSGADHGDPTLYPGQDVTIALTYRAQTRSRQLHIAVSVFDQRDRILFACDNEHTGEALGVLPCGTYRCLIPELPLSPGNYRVNVWAAVGGNIADYVEHAAEFTVSPSDFYGTGKLPDHPKFGPFLVKHRWTHG